MTTPLLKKQIAALAGISPATMRRRKKNFAFLARCRTQATGRPTYHAQSVQEELKRRKMI